MTVFSPAVKIALKHKSGIMLKEPFRRKGMLSKKTRFLWQILSVSLVIFLSLIPALAQIDPDPDSPTPVLLSEPNSTRALAAAADNSSRLNLSKSKSGVFYPHSQILLFVTNLDLMQGEGANAFRVYAEDEKGKQYRFPVLDIHSIPYHPDIYALTVQLTDEIGFSDSSDVKSDVLIGVAWRGLISNRVRLSLGGRGGNIKDDPGAVPTPIVNLPVKTTKDTPKINVVGYRYSGDRIRFLEQAAFGPTVDLDQRIRRIGLRTWLAEQFQAPYPTNPYPNLALMPTTVPTGCDAICRRDFYSMYQMQNWFYREAFYGEAQLKHRVAWTLGTNLGYLRLRHSAGKLDGHLPSKII